MRYEVFYNTATYNSSFIIKGDSFDDITKKAKVLFESKGMDYKQSYAGRTKLSD